MKYKNQLIIFSEMPVFNQSFDIFVGFFPF